MPHSHHFGKGSAEPGADEIAAFANADGGVLLCGITDAGKVQGVSRAQIVELDSVLIEVSSDVIKPAVRIRTHHAQLGVESGKGRNPTLSAGHRFLGHRYSPVRRI